MKKSTPILALTLAGLLAGCGVPSFSSAASSAQPSNSSRSVKGVYFYARSHNAYSASVTKETASYYFSQNGKYYDVEDQNGAISVQEFSASEFSAAIATVEDQSLARQTADYTYQSLQIATSGNSGLALKKAATSGPTISDLVGYSNETGSLAIQFNSSNARLRYYGDVRFESNLPIFSYFKQTPLTATSSAPLESVETQETFDWGHAEMIVPDMSAVKPTSSAPSSSSGEASSQSDPSIPLPPSIFKEVNPLDLPCGLGTTAMAKADTLAKAQAFDAELQSATPTEGAFSYHKVEHILDTTGHQQDFYEEVRIIPDVFGCSITEDSDFSESSDLEMVYAKNGEYFKLSNIGQRGSDTRERIYWKITKAEFDQEMAYTYPSAAGGDRQTKRDEINQYGVGAFSKYFLAVLTGENTTALIGEQKYTLDTTALGSLYAMETSLKASSDPEAPDDPWTGHNDFTVRFLGTDCASLRQSTTKNYTSGGTYVDTYEWSLQNNEAYPFYPDLTNYTLQTA
jgi:hypothetical protein